MGSAASSLKLPEGGDSAEGGAMPYMFDPLDGSTKPPIEAAAEGDAAPKLSDACAVSMTEAEAKRDELLAGKANLGTRCNELHDTMQFEALATLLREADETSATARRLAAALALSGELADALGAADKAVELAAEDHAALFAAQLERGIILRLQQTPEPAAEAFAAALSANAKAECPKEQVARLKRLSGKPAEALEMMQKATMRRDGKTPENFCELGHCQVASYAHALATDVPPNAGGKEAKQWNEKLLSFLVEGHQAFETAARKMESVGGHAGALSACGSVLEEIYLFQQMRALSEAPPAAKKEDKNEIEGFCFVDPQGEITAICKAAGNYEKLTDEQQLKCLEEEYKSFREFGVTDKADEVQALHGWKAKEIHRAKAGRKKKTASGPAAQFGVGGVKALAQAISSYEKAQKVSPHRAEFWLHAGRLRLMSLSGAEDDADADTAAIELAVVELRTACALTETKRAPPQTDLCSKFYLGLALAVRAQENGGPPSVVAKVHAQARSLMAAGMSEWLAVLKGEAPAWDGSAGLESSSPMRANNPAFVQAYLICGAASSTGDETTEMAKKYLRTVAELTPHLIRMFCAAIGTTVKDSLNEALLSAQISMIDCEVAARTLEEAPAAVHVGATLKLCQQLHGALKEIFDSGEAVSAGVRQLRNSACEKRTEIDAKRSEAWSEYGLALYSEYSLLSMQQRPDDSAEVKAESQVARLKLLGEAQGHFEKAIELEGSSNLTDEEVAAGKTHLEKAAGKGAKAAPAAKGKAAAPAAKGRAAPTPAARGKVAARKDRSAGRGAKGGKGAAAPAKGAKATAPVAKGGPAAPAKKEEPAAAATPAAVAKLTAANVAAAQIKNEKSVDARLSLAEVLKDSIEEHMADPDNASEEAKTAATALKERLVLLYNEIIELEPTKTDAYFGCCELLKAEGKLLEAVAVYCKYPLAPPGVEAPEGDAMIHGDIVTLLMRDPTKITAEHHEQLGISLTVFAKKNGLSTVEDWLEKLVGVNAFEVCKSVYCGVNGKPADDPEMVNLFAIKGYP